MAAIEKRRQLILSGGIFHDFEGTSAALAALADQRGIETEIVRHPDDAWDRLASGGIDLFTVNALRWQMEGEKYDPYRETWRYSIDDNAREVIRTFSAGGGALLGIHTAVICFSEWPGWGQLLGGHWRWWESFHPEPEALQVVPVDAAGPAFRPFRIEDELYSNLHINPDTEILMHGRNLEGSEQPLVWRTTAGPGRAAYSALGHDRGSLDNTGLQHVSDLVGSGLIHISTSPQELQGSRNHRAR